MRQSTPSILSSLVGPSEAKIRSKQLAYLVAVAVPLAINILWHGNNLRLPVFDAADYLRTAHDSYSAFHQNGLINGLASLYLNRGWRPILYPVFFVPALLLTSGQLAASVTLTLVFVHFILLTYLFNIADRYLSPLRACLVTMFIGTLPWLFLFFLRPYSESTQVACVVAALYHFDRSDYFRVKKHSLFMGLWIGLALCVRPVETILSLGILAVVIGAIALKKRTISLRDILAMSVFSIVLLTILMFTNTTYFNPNSPELGILIGCFILLASSLLLFWRRLKLHYAFILAGVFGFIMVFFWWLPSIQGLFSWAYETSFGSMSRLYPGTATPGLFPSLVGFFVTLGGVPLMMALGLIGLGLFTSKDAQAHTSKIALSLLLAASTFLVPIVLVILTYTSDYRRAYVGFTIFLLVCVAFAIHPKLAFPKLRLLICALVCAFQVGLQLSIALNIPSKIATLAQTNAAAIPFPDTKPDPSLSLFDAYPMQTLSPATIGVYTLAYQSQESRPLDVSLLRLLAIQKGLPRLNFDWVMEFSGIDEGYRLSRQVFDYALLDVTTDISVNSRNLTEPYGQLVSDMIRRWKSSTLASMGFSYVAEFDNDGKHLILLKIPKPITF